MSPSFNPPRTTVERVAALKPDIQHGTWNTLYWLWRSTGVQTQVTEGRRTLARQRELYAIGRTPGDRRPIVTQTIYGSKHLQGRAFDLDFVGFPPDQVPQWAWDLAGRIGEHFGLRWGGRFSFKDFRHFET